MPGSKPVEAVQPLVKVSCTVGPTVAPVMSISVSSISQLDMPGPPAVLPVRFSARLDNPPGCLQVAYHKHLYEMVKIPYEMVSRRLHSGNNMITFS